jgi:hypothetical protein
VTVRVLDDLFVLGTVMVVEDEEVFESVTITTPVPLHVVHFVTVVTFFFFDALPFAGI